MQHSGKQLQKGWCGDTVEGYPEPALQQKTEEKRDLKLGSSEHWKRMNDKMFNVFLSLSIIAVYKMEDFWDTMEYDADDDAAAAGDDHDDDMNVF